MSSIDCYKHSLIGFIECPSTDNVVYENETREIPVYRLLQDVPAGEVDFDGRVGDILLGGGSGEAPAMRISIEKCLPLFMADEYVHFSEWDELYKAFWTPTESYIYGEGFHKLGWTPEIRQLEGWLTERICEILCYELEEFEKYRKGDRIATSLKWRVAKDGEGAM